MLDGSFVVQRIRKGHSREIRLCFVRPRVGIPIMHRDQPCIEGMPSGPETRLVEDFQGFSPIEVDTRQLRSFRGSAPIEDYTFSCSVESRPIGNMELEDFIHEFVIS